MGDGGWLGEARRRPEEPLGMRDGPRFWEVRVMADRSITMLGEATTQQGLEPL